MSSHRKDSLNLPELTGAIEHRIYSLRGQRVMLSFDLSALYEVQPKALVQAVKRNIDRFPQDFMFQLSDGEFRNLKSQFATSSWGGLRRAAPYAFTEEGVAMLSSVLHSECAIDVNIAIMRAFVKLRRAVLTNRDVSHRVEKLEGKVAIHETDIRLMQDDLKQ